jgi:hypothetical protein
MDATAIAARRIPLTLASATAMPTNEEETIAIPTVMAIAAIAPTAIKT